MAAHDLEDEMNTKLKLALFECGRPAYLIAAEVGMSETRLSRVVTGRLRPTPEEARAVAEQLGHEVDDLFPEVAQGSGR